MDFNKNSTHPQLKDEIAHFNFHFHIHIQMKLKRAELMLEYVCMAKLN